MSLFPAYNPSTSNCDKDEKDISTNINLKHTECKNIIPDLSWLQNSSYISLDSTSQDTYKNQKKERTLPDTNDASVPDDISNEKKKKKKKHKKEKHSRSKVNEESRRSAPLKILENDPFFEDKKQERGNFLVNTLHRPAIPNYVKNNCYFKRYKYLMKKHKETKRKVRRYFILTPSKKDAEEDYSTDQSGKEEQLTRVTEDFNKRLATNPNDVNLWLEYVKFQDTIYDFEKAYRKNPIGGERVTSERKLAILERGMKSNPASDQLLEEKLLLCERVMPADQLATECMRMLTQDPGNLVLWRALIRSTRNTMARCTVPGVQQLFTKAISRINQLRLHRQAMSVEKDLLALVLECGLFFQQAGLWEQLWTLLQMYLSLSLTASGNFDVNFPVEDGNLKEQEDSVVASGLPLSVLWLRVEQLRAAAHFLPDPNCDSDPQRVVFSDDMAGLVQPVMSPQLRLPLVVTTAVLLKVPLLPSRHCLLSTLGLLTSPSFVSNVEDLLPAVTATGRDCRWLQGCAELISEPQYIKSELYLDWVVRVMQLCADVLPFAESVIVHCWVLRLYGMLCRLTSLDLASVPSSVPKRARAYAKQLLKSPQLRDNLILFTEYALLERDTGDTAKACKILETAAAMAPTATKPKVEYVFLCRRLVQCLLLKDSPADKDRALSALVALGECQPLSSAAAATSDVGVKRSLSQWQRQTSSLVDSCLPQAEESVTLEKTSEVMAPQLIVEWISCHALLLTLTTSIWEATALVQRHIDLLPHNSGNLGWCWVEQLYEVLADIMYSHCHKTATGFTLLRDTLSTALATFPNNLTLLSTLASVETSGDGGGSPLWKLVSYFPPSAALARLILVFVVRYRVSRLNTGDIGVTSCSPYLRSVLGRLTTHPVTGQCPLVWRLYLQLVTASGTAAEVKQAFYRCVNTCPWVKSFYMDAVKFLPEDMSEILDLIIEKELRLHTTPEELEILRD